LEGVISTEFKPLGEILEALFVYLISFKGGGQMDIEELNRIRELLGKPESMVLSHNKLVSQEELALQRLIAFESELKRDLASRNARVYR